MDAPSFEEWYAALNDRAPFPWQSRLAQRLDDQGWPTEVGVETGLGKTACLDIAIWWLASQADRPPVERTAPTRIWWLVNRRLLVDTTADHAEHIATRLADPQGDEVVQAVAHRLQRMSADEHTPPLEVIRLRGGAATGRPSDPSQPAVILSTIPMYGSRLLFRGYGSSRSMRPIDAALAGTDSLVLVDEAHLAHHLMGLFDPLTECDRSTVDVLPPPRRRSTVVSLTATGSSVGDRLLLGDDDLAHETVRQRLDAAKPLRIVEGTKRDDLAELLAQQAEATLHGVDVPTTCVVFVNAPATARTVAGALAGSASPPREVLIATGRQREREARLVRQRLTAPGTGVTSTTGDPRRPCEKGASIGPTPDHPPRTEHLVVVATQTLEVGADLDFAHMVTECCGVRSLTQRLGRLNRLGHRPDSTATYIHLPAPSGRRGDGRTWPVYGGEPAHVLERLRASAVDDVISMSPARVREVLGPPQDDPGRAPEVMPDLLWEWVKTTNPPPGEAPVEPYFSGLADPSRQVAVCWRAWLPELDLPDGADDLSSSWPIWPRVRGSETIDVPLSELRQALETAGVEQVRVLSPDRASVTLVDVGAVRPGVTVILPSSMGLYDDHGWSPMSRTSVPDVILQSHGLPLDADLLTSGLAAMRTVQAREATVEVHAAIDMLQRRFDDSDDDDRREVLNRLRAALGVGDRPPAIALDERGDDPEAWYRFLDELSWEPEDLVRSPLGEVRIVLRQATARSMRIDEMDECSADANRPVLLDVHGRDAGRRARDITKSIGLTGAASTVELAAELHDIGKADERFQRWLSPAPVTDEVPPLAKSTSAITDWRSTRVAAGWPSGGRHEALSARLVEEWIATGAADAHPDVDLDLLVHLVVSHHGRARPLLVPVPDRTGTSVATEVRGQRVHASADLSVADWEQPRRFRFLGERYGHWGLALLEAVVRQADHTVSRQNWAGPSTEVV